MPSIRYQILDLLTDDIYGPWELLIQMDGSRSSIADELKKLIHECAVAWCSRSSHSAPALPLAAESFPRLDELSTWQASELDQTQLLLEITGTGREEYWRLMKLEFDWPATPEL